MNLERVSITLGGKTYGWTYGGDPADLDQAIEILQIARSRLAPEPEAQDALQTALSSAEPMDIGGA